MRRRLSDTMLLLIAGLGVLGPLLAVLALGAGLLLAVSMHTARQGDFWEAGWLTGLAVTTLACISMRRRRRA